MFPIGWQTKLIAGGILTAVCVMVLWHYQHTIRENNRLENDLRLEQAAVKNCQRFAELNERVSNEYQTKLSDLGRRLSDVKRLYDDAICIPVKTASRPDAAAAEGKLSGTHGIMVESLLEFAAECERSWDLRI